ncbi:NAD-dependent epimerase/dehydratase family protein [Nocardioides nanhaiensis]|uniref:SDR family oxidoreductase n=1 Tax=Nocardioides nanhaiensis TaxID=1476871 RepID=A0ABP8VR81_9ACTN
MLILVLGGTVFLSRATAQLAAARGHTVVCASRGVTGSPPDGVRHVVWERAEAVPDDLAGLAPDVVVDVSRTPSHVRRAVAAWPAAHWVFVSTVNVYADDRTRGGGPASLALREPLHHDADPSSDPDAYGAMKVACEQAVQQGAASASIVRPGLIVGPGDPTGRFGYWPERLGSARPGESVLAPGDPGDVVQVLDVRDLAAWLVDLAERRHRGVLDAVGPATPLGDLLAAVADGVGAQPALTWVDQGFLQARGVEPWMGDDAVPLWLPRPDHDGMMDHDTTAPLTAGLVTRPVAATARDTLAWLREHPDAARTGIGGKREAELLAAWQREPSGG